ncbi:hypothetical protein IJ579_00445 [bacterium]|nr:hypothetical protein [bacterium]
MVAGSVTDIAGKPVQPFKTLRYVTKDGESCIATKNNGVVTIQGDKNGIRQMPLNDFMQNELLQNVEPLGAQALERTPQQDTVSFAGKNDPNQMTYKEALNFSRDIEYSRPSMWTGRYTMDNEENGMHLNVRRPFTGGTKFEGTIANKDVDLKIRPGAFTASHGNIKGTIDGKEVDLKYTEMEGRKGIQIEGEVDDDVKKVLLLLTADVIEHYFRNY